MAENRLVESGITEENGDRRGVLLLLGQRQTQRRERDQDDAEHDEADAPPESLDDSVDVPPIRLLAGALARHLKTCGLAGILERRQSGSTRRDALDLLPPS